MKQESFPGFSTFDYQILVINLYLLLLAIICSITESNPQIRTVQMPTHCNEQTKTEHHPESLKGMGQGGNSLKLLYVSCYRPAWHKYSCTPTGSVCRPLYLVWSPIPTIHSLPATTTSTVWWYGGFRSVQQQQL